MSGSVKGRSKRHLQPKMTLLRRKIARVSCGRRAQLQAVGPFRTSPQRRPQSARDSGDRATTRRPRPRARDFFGAVRSFLAKKGKHFGWQIDTRPDPSKIGAARPEIATLSRGSSSPRAKFGQKSPPLTPFKGQKFSERPPLKVPRCCCKIDLRPHHGERARARRRRLRMSFGPKRSALWSEAKTRRRQGARVVGPKVDFGAASEALFGGRY